MPDKGCPGIPMYTHFFLPGNAEPEAYLSEPTARLTSPCE